MCLYELSSSADTEVESSVGRLLPTYEPEGMKVRHTAGKCDSDVLRNISRAFPSISMVPANAELL